MYDFFCHVTIGLAICGFLYVINYNHTPILHVYKDIKPRRFWGQDFDILVHVTPFVTSRDHFTCNMRFPVGTVVNYNHMCILHGYGDMEPQIYLGHDIDLLGSRDVIGHVTI